MQRLGQFSSQKKDVQWHLPSAYSNEMAMKSTVVSSSHYGLTVLGHLLYYSGTTRRNQPERK